MAGSVVLVLLHQCYYCYGGQCTACPSVLLLLLLRRTGYCLYFFTAATNATPGYQCIACTSTLLLLLIWLARSVWLLMLLRLTVYYLHISTAVTITMAGSVLLVLLHCLVTLATAHIVLLVNMHRFHCCYGRLAVFCFYICNAVTVAMAYSVLLVFLH